MSPSNEKRIQVLLVTGELTGEHDPKVNHLLRRVLESTGRFRVKITEEFRGCTEETLAPYDLVLINYDGDPKPLGTWPEAVKFGARAESALLDFVQSGKGVVFYHSSVFASPWPLEFLKMMGGYCDPKKGSRKNPRLDFPVTVSNHDHPITAGLVNEFNLVQEDLFAGVIWHPEAKPTVLATAFDDEREYRDMSPHLAAMMPPAELITDMNQDQPVAWTHRYGEGRVFVVTIGHGIDTIRRPGFVALFCRAAEWAATGEVTIPPPDLRGDNRRRAWPYYTDISIVEYSSMVP
jgi:type 1 glutamine amidotransferase